MPPSASNEYRNQQVTTTGVIVDEKSVNVDLAGASIDEVLSSQVVTGYVTVDLVALDPRTGAPTSLHGVRVETPNSTTVSGFRKGQRFVVVAASYEDFITKNVKNITAVPAPETPTVQNQSIPSQVKYPDPMGKFGGKPMAKCEKYQKTEQEAKSRMGFIADRSDIVVLQGKDNGRSPGILIQQADGRLYMFDITGEQYVAMGDHSVKAQTPLFNFGNAEIGRNTLAFPVPMVENKVLDIVPNGTLLTPQPRLLINFLEALNLIGSVMDLIRLGKLCRDAVRIVRGAKQGSLEQQVQKARISSLEKAYYGKEETARKALRGSSYVPPAVGEDQPDVTVEPDED